MHSKHPDWIEARADVFENVPFAALRIGQRARLVRRVTRETIEHFAASTGDVNPAHLDEGYARASRFGGIIAHGMWSGALISAVLGTLLPGPGTIYLEQTLKYLKPVRPGDVLSAEVTVAALRRSATALNWNAKCATRTAMRWCAAWPRCWRRWSQCGARGPSCKPSESK